MWIFIKNSTLFNNTVTLNKGFNIYLNPSDRNLTITNPVYGQTSFIKQDDLGNTVNDFQFYDVVLHEHCHFLQHLKDADLPFE